jgi:MFS transporter, MFS domain-containing protein family, molybdate-anion transporter
MWTPALTESEDVQLPFGLIFSTFMVCCMAGSSMFSILSEHGKCEQLAVWLFATAALSMLIIAASFSATTTFLAMNIFEMSVGMYFPLMGTMKGAIVPESMRAAIYNLYRIPLNFIVLISLLTKLTPKQSFALNFAMLATAACLQFVLMKRRELNGKTIPGVTKIDDDDGIDSSPLLDKAHAV